MKKIYYLRYGVKNKVSFGYYKTKKEAIIILKQILNGSGINKDKYPVSMRGDIAKELWNKSAKFDYGFEYGYILGLMEAFNIKEKEIL